MATTFWLSVRYNFGRVIASDMLFDSMGGFSGQAIQWRHSRFWGSKRRCHGNYFLAFFIWVHIGATWRIRLNHPCAASMVPYVKLLWPLVFVFIVPWFWSVTLQNHCVFYFGMMMTTMTTMITMITIFRFPVHVPWHCWLGNRMHIQLVKRTCSDCPLRFFLGTLLSWSKSGKESQFSCNWSKVVMHCSNVTHTFSTGLTDCWKSYT